MKDQGLMMGSLESTRFHTQPFLYSSVFSPFHTTIRLVRLHPLFLGKLYTANVPLIQLAASRFLFGAILLCLGIWLPDMGPRIWLLIGATISMISVLLEEYGRIRHRVRNPRIVEA